MTDSGAMAAAADPPSPPTTGLKCTLCSAAVENDETSSNKKLELFFRPDEIKKSVFWLDAPDTATSTAAQSQSQSYNVNAPAHCYIEHCESTTFFLGGFQLVSNAKTVEIYTVSGDNSFNAKEEYLTTSRGIPSQENPGSFKVMCVVPGGPRPILRLHLKLLSLKPPSTSEESMAKLVSIKLTARIPPVPAVPTFGTPPLPLQPQPPHTDTTSAKSASTAANTTSSTLPNPNQHPPSAGPTMEDVGAAMAGVSFMVRSTEDRLVETMQEQFSRLQVAAQQNHQSVDVRFQVLQQTVRQQTALLERQHATMQQQHVLLEQQGHALETLQQQQQDMLCAFTSMQTHNKLQSQPQCMGHTDTHTPAHPRTKSASEPEIVEVISPGGIRTVMEDMDEQGPLEMSEVAEDATPLDEAVSDDHDHTSDDADDSSSVDTLDESDVVFVEKDDDDAAAAAATTSSSSKPSDQEPATHQDSTEEVYISRISY